MIRQRAAERRDLNAIGEIYVETWRDTYAGILPDDMLLRMSPDIEASRWSRVIDGKGVVIVAETEVDGVVGFGSAGRSRLRALPYGAEIYTLYVSPDHQGRGAGRLLLTALFERLARAGHSSALIWVLRDNQARFFYEAMGGRHAADREERLWGTAVAECAYAWDRLAVPCSPP